MEKKIIHIIGGGTFNHIRAHLSIAAPAFGQTAIKLKKLCEQVFDLNKYEVRLHLTKMADRNSKLVTNVDISKLFDNIIADKNSKIVFMNAALSDFEGSIDNIPGSKNSPRLKTINGKTNIKITPSPKLIKKLRETNFGRKDLFVIGFKTTHNESSQDQYLLGLNLLKSNSINLVLANDVGSRNNMIIVPEEAVYAETVNRDEVLKELVNIVFHRHNLHYTNTITVDNQGIEWGSKLIPDSLRSVVDYCIESGAYKPFRGSTAGHFAIKTGDGEFVTSPRKKDFNKLKSGEVNMVKIQTVGQDEVKSFGGKPSVGGQSQRIVFAEHPELDSIVHFHSTLKSGSKVPVVSQREFECGSHECGQNTSNGLTEIEPGIHAVYLDKHGPNIVFNSKMTDASKVISFIDNNFNLSEKSGGYQLNI